MSSHSSQSGDASHIKPKCNNSRRATGPADQNIFALDLGKYSFLRQERLPGIRDRNWLIPRSLAQIIVAIAVNENTPYD
jgi:hypothetical protein